MVGITNIIIRNGQDNCGTSTSQLMFELNSKTLQAFQNISS